MWIISFSLLIFFQIRERRRGTLPGALEQRWQRAQMEWQSLQLRDFLRLWSTMINLRERLKEGTKCTKIFMCKYQFMACPQGDPRGNCVWHSRPSIRFSELSEVERLDMCARTENNAWLASRYYCHVLHVQNSRVCIQNDN